MNNEPSAINLGRAATIELGHPLNSNTHTDSAGGEACDNEEDTYKLVNRAGSSLELSKRASPRD